MFGNRMWWVNAALVVTLLVLAFRLVMGEGGLADRHLQQKLLDDQRAKVDMLRERNDALAAEVTDLKSGTAAAEARARQDLGMILPRETFYLITPPP